MINNLNPLLKNPEKLEDRLKTLPTDSGVYLMRDHLGEILYIGKSKKLRSRIRSYFRPSQPLSPRIALMVQQVCEIEFIVTDTEVEALALESNLIKQYQPHFNILLKDDKKYPYVCITWSEEYPRIFMTRKRRLNNPKDRYYGPYVDTHTLRETLNLIKRIFPLRQRPKPLFKDRPCLNYDMGRCPGVCQSLIPSQEYHQIVKKVAMIFQGRTDELIKTLQSQMQIASENLNFEQAAKLRDQIKAIEYLNADQKVSLPNDTISKDAIALATDHHHYCIQLFQIRAGRLVGRLGFFAEGNSEEIGTILQRVLEEHYLNVDSSEIPPEILVQYPLPETDIIETWLTEKKGRKVTVIVPQKQNKADLIAMVQKNAQYELEKIQQVSEKNTQALEDLKNILGLSAIPKRIEGYDISHIQGSNAVASQVVFIDGIPAKQYYRHYKIKNPHIRIGHSDDFASLAEIITRRFRKYVYDNSEFIPDESFPDVVMIDGGKGQLSSVVSQLEEMKLLPYLTVISLAKKREEIFIPYQSKPLTTDCEQPGVQLLRRVRDEAHRFALTFHRQQRLKESRRSRLEEIPGLGFQRQKQLLDHFHSIDYIREASIEQLKEVTGIGDQLAQQIYNYFHPTFYTS